MTEFDKCYEVMKLYANMGLEVKVNDVRVDGSVHVLGTEIVCTLVANDDGGVSFVIATASYISAIKRNALANALKEHGYSVDKIGLIDASTTDIMLKNLMEVYYDALKWRDTDIYRNAIEGLRQRILKNIDDMWWNDRHSLRGELYAKLKETACSAVSNCPTANDIVLNPAMYTDFTLDNIDSIFSLRERIWGDMKLMAQCVQWIAQKALTGDV